MAAINAPQPKPPAAVQTSAQRPAYNPWAIALTVTMATFMELLDTSISNVSLPHIAGGLGTSYDESTWVLTSYLVANAIILPMSAWLSRVFGRKRYYMMCVALFTATSFLCGVAPSLATLIAFRVLQGIGGRRLRIDYVGIALIAIGFACLEVVLDRGERDDWLESHFIATFLAIAVVAIAIAIWWEWRHDDPVVELTLLRERNFAIANLYYFIFGFGLFGSTVLIPELLQTLFGYTATDAGLVLGPGAAVITVLAPFVARISPRIGSKRLLAFSFTAPPLPFFSYPRITPPTYLFPFP